MTKLVVAFHNTASRPRIDEERKGGNKKKRNIKNIVICDRSMHNNNNFRYVSCNKFYSHSGSPDIIPELAQL